MLSNLTETLHSSAKSIISKQPKFEVSNLKNKNLAPKSGFQKVWKILLSNYKRIFTEKHFLNKFKISYELCIPQRVIKGEHNNNLYEIKRRKLCNAQAVSHNRNKLRIKSHSNFHVIMATSHTQWVHLRLNSVPCLLEGAIQDFRVSTWGNFA